MRGFVRELVVAGALAMSGPDDLTVDDIALLDRNAKAQQEYLDRFEREIIASPPPELGQADLLSQVILVEPPRSVAQRVAQAEAYGNAVWSSTINAGRAIVQKQAVFASERRVHLLSFMEHKPCQTCIEESRKGWQPMGTLAEIGDSECMGNCDCYFEWRDANDKIFVSPWGRHNPKGYNQPGAAGTRLPGIAYPPDQHEPPYKDTRPKGGGRKPDTTTVINKEPEPPVAPSAIPPATREEIDKEVKKWIAGEPSRLTVKKKYAKAPEPEFELPEGYEWSE